MLPTNFEKIPEIVKELQEIIGHAVWAEIHETGIVDFVQYIGIKRTFGYESIFHVYPREDIMVAFIHWKRNFKNAQ